jgi:glucose/arabinose dehydrogenase
VASGLASPVALTHAGDGSGRLFVVDQVGVIRVIDAGGTLLPTPYLDLAGRVVTVEPTFDERGALGLAFHPDFATNGRLFVRYSAPRLGMPGEPCFGPPYDCHDEILSEFQVAGDPTTTHVVDPATEQVLFRVAEPQFNHDAGDLHFGPDDGYLYFTLGDGGGAHDGLADPVPSHGPIGNGQDLDTTLGKVLRIDVDSAPSPGLAYAIPPTNPFAGGGGAPEIYAWGFRNPYRFSFDDGPGGSGDLIVADVGQNLYEEVDVVELGQNYGWVLREGFHCFDPFDPENPPPTCPTTGLGGEPLRDPVLEYDHDVGLAVVGGYVYRGSDVPLLVGKYFFGDFSRDFGPTGQLFHADVAGVNAWIRVSPMLPGDAPLGRVLKGIGEDEDGELYVLTGAGLSPTGTTGTVHRVVAAP